MNGDCVKNYCLDKWSGGSELDKRLEHFSETYCDWISKIPESSRNIVEVLIKNLEYFSRKNVNAWLKKLHSELMSTGNINDDNTIYTFIKSKDGISNSSNDYWTEYRLINDINNNLCYENIDAISLEQWEYISNIVFIDDFSGTGNSFIKELEKHDTLFENKNIYFIVISIMDSALKKFCEYKSQYNVNIITFKAFCQQKAFEKDLFNDNNKAKTEIKKLSQERGIPKSYIMGYDNSQALVAYYNNTPNNTIGLIYYNTDCGESLFPRKKEYRPTWQKMKNQNIARKNANYKNISR